MKIEITITGTPESATAQLYRIQADGSREYLGNLTASLATLLGDILSLYPEAQPQPAQAGSHDESAAS